MYNDALTELWDVPAIKAVVGGLPQDPDTAYFSLFRSVAAIISKEEVDPNASLAITLYFCRAPLQEIDDIIRLRGMQSARAGSNMPEDRSGRRIEYDKPNLAAFESPLRLCERPVETILRRIALQRAAISEASHQAAINLSPDADDEFGQTRSVPGTKQQTPPASRRCTNSPKKKDRRIKHRASSSTFRVNSVSPVGARDVVHHGHMDILQSERQRHESEAREMQAAYDSLLAEAGALKSSYDALLAESLEQKAAYEALLAESAARAASDLGNQLAFGIALAETGTLDLKEKLAQAQRHEAELARQLTEAAERSEQQTRNLGEQSSEIEALRRRISELEYASALEAKPGKLNSFETLHPASHRDKQELVQLHIFPLSANFGASCVMGREASGISTDTALMTSELEQIRVQLAETQHLALSVEERLNTSEKQRLDEGQELRQQLDETTILLELQSRQTEAAERRASAIRAQLAESLDLATKHYQSWQSTLARGGPIDCAAESELRSEINLYQRQAEAWAAREQELTSQIDRNESDLVVLSEHILGLECKCSRLLMANADCFAETSSPVEQAGLAESTVSSPPVASFSVSNELELVLVPRPAASARSLHAKLSSDSFALSNLAGTSLCWSTTARLLEEFAEYHCAVMRQLSRKISSRQCRAEVQFIGRDGLDQASQSTDLPVGNTIVVPVRTMPCNGRFAHEPSPMLYHCHNDPVGPTGRGASPQGPETSPLLSGGSNYDILALRESERGYRERSEQLLAELELVCATVDQYKASAVAEKGQVEQALLARETELALVKASATCEKAELQRRLREMGDELTGLQQLHAQRSHAAGPAALPTEDELIALKLPGTARAAAAGSDCKLCVPIVSGRVKDIPTAKVFDSATTLVEVRASLAAEKARVKELLKDNKRLSAATERTAELKRKLREAEESAASESKRADELARRQREQHKQVQVISIYEQTCVERDELAAKLGQAQSRLEWQIDEVGRISLERDSALASHVTARAEHSRLVQQLENRLSEYSSRLDNMIDLADYQAVCSERNQYADDLATERANGVDFQKTASQLQQRVSELEVNLEQQEARHARREREVLASLDTLRRERDELQHQFALGKASRLQADHELASLREELGSSSARAAVLTKDNARLKTQLIDRVRELKLQLKLSEEVAQKEAARAEEMSKRFRDHQKQARRASADTTLPRLRKSLGADQSVTKSDDAVDAERHRVLEERRSAEMLRSAELQSAKDEAVAEAEKLRAELEVLADSHATLQGRVDELTRDSESRAKEDDVAFFNSHAYGEVCTERDWLLVELDNQSRQLTDLQRQIVELEAQAQLDLCAQIEEVEERAQLQATEAQQRIRELEGQLHAVSVRSMAP